MKETHTRPERHRIVNSEEIDFFWHLRPIRKINECLTDLSAPFTHKSSATLLVNRLEAFTDISYQTDPICRARIVNLRKLICGREEHTTTYAISALFKWAYLPTTVTCQNFRDQISFCQ